MGERTFASPRQKVMVPIQRGKCGWTGDVHFMQWVTRRG